MSAALERMSMLCEPSLHVVLRDVATQAPELAGIRDEIASRRATNMRLIAQDFAAARDLRTDIAVDEIAAVVWSMHATEFYQPIVNERGCHPPASSYGSPTRGAASSSRHLELKVITGVAVGNSTSPL
jgi:hypothetical protein